MHRLLTFLLALVAFGQLQAGDFEDATQLYENARYEEAQKAFGALAERGEWSANLFYNLGNVAYRLNSPGEAALQYERALALEGSHREAKANLQWLRNQTGAKLPQLRWWERAFAPFSADMFAIAGVVAGWGVLFALVGILFRRRTLGWLVFFVLLGGYAGAGFWIHRADEDRAIITDKEAVARLAPADRAAVAETLPAGSQVQILSERGAWIYCALPGGGLGWLPSEKLEKVRLSRS